MRSPGVLSCGRQGQSGYKLQRSEAGIQMCSSPDHAQFTRPGVRLRSLLSRNIYLRSADIYRLAQQMQRDNQEKNQLKMMHDNWR